MNPYFSNEEITLYHGDCAGIEVQCDLIVTDPPYGQEFKSVGRWHDGITPEQISEQLSSARAALQAQGDER